jgi:hypothetical protein
MVRQPIRLRSRHATQRRRRDPTACVRYVRQPDGTCHFKSNDGHYAHWNFPLTRYAPIADRQPSLALSRLCLRLNIHVAQAALKHNGLIIVDSTRKGKRFPDRFGPSDAASA